MTLVFADKFCCLSNCAFIMLKAVLSPRNHSTMQNEQQPLLFESSQPAGFVATDCTSGCASCENYLSRMSSSGMLHLMTVGRIDVLEELSASIIWVTGIHECNAMYAMYECNVFLHRVSRLLVTANVPRSPILVTQMMEALISSETSILPRATRRNIPDDGIVQRGRRMQRWRFRYAYSNANGWPIQPFERLNGSHGRAFAGNRMRNSGLQSAHGVSAMAFCRCRRCGNTKVGIIWLEVLRRVLRLLSSGMWCLVMQ
jgi:hypothetical protein